MFFPPKRRPTQPYMVHLRALTRSSGCHDNTTPILGCNFFLKQCAIHKRPCWDDRSSKQIRVQDKRVNSHGVRERRYFHTERSSPQRMHLSQDQSQLLGEVSGSVHWSHKPKFQFSEFVLCVWSILRVEWTMYAKILQMSYDLIRYVRVLMRTLHSHEKGFRKRSERTFLQKQRRLSHQQYRSARKNIEILSEFDCMTTAPCDS